MPDSNDHAEGSVAGQERMRDLLRNMMWAIGLVWKACPSLVMARAVLVIVRGGIPAMVIFGVKAIVDALGETGDIAASMPWLLFVPVLLLLTTILEGIADYVQTRLTDELGIAINVGILRHAARLDLTFFENPSRQNVMARSRQNSVRHCETLVAALAELSRVVIQIVTLSALVIVVEPMIAPVMIVLAAPYCLLQFRLAKRRYRVEHRRTQRVRWSQYFSSLMTGYQTVPEIKLLRLAPMLIDRFRSLALQFRNENRTLQQVRAIISVVFGILFSTIVCILAYRLLNQAIAGVVTFGSVAAFVLASERLFSSVGTMIAVISRSVHSAMMVANLRLFHEAEPEQVTPGTVTPAHASGAIEFADVSFAYPNAAAPVLSNVSFRVKSGEVVALVGRNGAGKTTLVKLLGKLYAPSGGKIILDGTDLKKLSDEYLFENTAFVMQMYGRYEATAAENIAFGDWPRLDGNEEAVREIARRVGVMDLIERLPNGFDTLLGRSFGEVTLSGGEWQALAVARALARDSKIVVLDEPTASLDPSREHELLTHVRKLLKGRTALIVSHRLTTVRFADRIIVLDQGRVVEQGGHAELLAANGEYARLFAHHRAIYSA